METRVLRRVRLTNVNNEHIDPKFIYRIPDWETLRSYDERAILYSKNYEEIFHKKFKEDNYKDSKRGIVKIRHLDKTIYRLFTAKGIDADTIGLTNSSILELGIKEGDVTLNITRANTFCGKFWFYYNHPFHEVRVPLKIAYAFGIISILLGFLSIVLAILPLLK